MIKTVAGASIIAFAGCMEDDNEPGENGNSSDTTNGNGADDWEEFDLDYEIEYDFPENGQVSYETDQPAEVGEVEIHRKGEEVEIMGILEFNESIPLSVEVRAEFYGGGEDQLGTPNDSLREVDLEEETFTLSHRSTQLDIYEGFILHVEGPEPDD